MNDFSTDVDSASVAVETAVSHYLRRRHSDVNDLTHELIAGPLGTRAVDAAVMRVIREHLGQLWDQGWLPMDVYQMVRRKRPKSAHSLVVDAIAGYAAAYAASTIHPRWHEQLAELEAEPWWDQSRPHASQWEQRHGLSRSSALLTVIELIALFKTMGPLPVIVPPPGGLTGPETHNLGSPVDERILGKIRALLAKAESTPFSEEAEALSAKAQELMTRHSIKRAMAGAGGSHEPAASARRIWLDSPYVTAKSFLVSSVASANRCRSVIYDGLGFVTVLGDDVDLEHVELLITSLMVQATRAMLSSGPQVASGGKSRTRSFRHSFLIAYATRIGERLREINRASMESAGAELVPIFARRREAVDRLFASLFPHRLASRSVSVGNAAGYGAGRAAADQAVLRAGRREVSPRH
ncbi:DUF2786 domain-containing protein [Phytoactinopolyspora endophytica]|uniref:DUF2786 domain-containing protein n=1 Tax=Phytoactinopolyspora endophytica TaxID=1642495 RepID=UPI0013EC41A5|nr:DUF2786 domain-containing protein [Phytoactinopolyspora endophytica]